MRSHVRAGVTRAASVLSTLRASGDTPSIALRDALPRASSAFSGSSSTSGAPPPSTPGFPAAAVHLLTQGLSTRGSGSWGLVTRVPRSQLASVLVGPRAQGLGFKAEGLGRRHLSSVGEQKSEEAPESEEVVTVAVQEQETEAVQEAEAEAVVSEPQHSDTPPATPPPADSDTAKKGPSVRGITSAMARKIREGRSLRAIGIFQNAVKRGTVPDVPLYTTLIHAYAMLDKRLDAEEAYETMLNAGLEPSERCMGIMMSLYARTKEFDRAWALYEQIRNAGLDPAPHIYTTLINCAFIQGDAELAQKFFDQAKEDGKVGASQWGVMIEHLVRGGEVRQAVGLMREMLDAGIEPNAWAYTCVLQGLLRAGSFPQAYSTLSFMAAQGPAPDLSTLTVLLDALRTAEGESAQWLGLLLKATKNSAYDYLVGLGTLFVDSSVENKTSLLEVLGPQEGVDMQETKNKRAFARMVTELLHVRGLDGSAVKVWEEAQDMGLFLGRICIDPAEWTRQGTSSEVDLRDFKPALAPFVSKYAILQLAKQFVETNRMPDTVELITGWRGVARGDAEPSRSEEVMDAVSSMLEEEGLGSTSRKGCVVVSGDEVKAWLERNSPLPSAEAMFVDTAAASVIDVDAAKDHFAEQVPEEVPASRQELVEVLEKAADQPVDTE